MSKINNNLIKEQINTLARSNIGTSISIIIPDFDAETLQFARTIIGTINRSHHTKITTSKRETGNFCVLIATLDDKPISLDLNKNKPKYSEMIGAVMESLQITEQEYCKLTGLTAAQVYSYRYGFRDPKDVSLKMMEQMAYLALFHPDVARSLMVS